MVVVVTITMLAPAHCFTVDSRYVLSSAVLSLCRVELETKVVEDYAKYKGPSTQLPTMLYVKYLHQEVMKLTVVKVKIGINIIILE